MSGKQEVLMGDLLRLARGRVDLVQEAFERCLRSPGKPPRLEEIVRYLARLTCPRCSDGSCNRCRERPQYPSRDAFNARVRQAR